MAKMGPKARKVMGEYKRGKLHSGKGGPIVKDVAQAVAIAMSEQRRRSRKKHRSSHMKSTY